MKLTFWGAARQVTGSMFLLETDDEYRILIDCGTDLRREYNDPNFASFYDQTAGIFPFDPSLINLVVLTHAHIDHSGNIPNLVREGYEGQILSTAPTFALSQLLLIDSANLHRKRLAQLNGTNKERKRLEKSGIDIKEMYNENNAEESFERFVTLQFKQRFKVKPGLYITLIPAGHLLGAGYVLVENEENGKVTKVGFSGDIGRYNYPLLPDPEPMPEVDYLICESTYGSRNHTDSGDPVDILEDIIRKRCVDIPGRLIIPSFSVGRTQALLFTLNRLWAEKSFPPVKVFADSPLAVQSTKVYEKYVNRLNSEAQGFYGEHGNLFDFRNLHYVENMKQSKAVANHNEACIIISSSGMISGGRVEYHVRQNISNPYSTILMVGYSAEGTLGHQLMQGEKSVTFGGKEMSVGATIARTDIFSGHGDRRDLMRFIKQQNPEKVKAIFLVHGEENSMGEFREGILAEGYGRVEIPAKGDTYELD
ncbi:MAG: MBL fold metallo-hydrolase [Bacteroidota bacterium]